MKTINSTEEKRKIFKRSSTTYYYSSLFFTGQTKEDVFTLYAFVRYADNLVDAIPPKKNEFFDFCKNVQRAYKGEVIGDHIIDDFIELSKRKKFEQAWTSAFLDSMKADLTKHTYHTYEELQKYMYGSANVIGLFMCAIFDTGARALPNAQAQGEAMQFINFIRDIDEDFKLGRQYIPTHDVKKFHTHIPPKPSEEEAFRSLVRNQIDKYRKVQQYARKGHKYIDRRFRIMVKTSADMYEWTADQIYKDPMVVFQKKIKPAKWYVIATVIKHALFS